MKFKGITKLQEGRFITRYDLHYETADGKAKDYEMISRSKSLDSFEALYDHPAEAVVLILHDESGEKVRVWTVNNEKDMKNFIQHDLEAVITNYPDVALRVRREVTGC